MSLAVYDTSERKTGAKSYYSDFSNVKHSFRLFRKISRHCNGVGSAADDEKMKSVIKMIITVAAYLSPRLENYEIINLTE